MDSSTICHTYASKQRSRVAPEADDPPWVTEWLLAADGDRFVGVSSAALAWNRSVETIKKWEYRGVIPRTPFDWRGRRAYTVEQVEGIAEILDRYGALTWPIVAATKTVKISSEADQLQRRLLSEYRTRLHDPEWPRPTETDSYP